MGEREEGNREKAKWTEEKEKMSRGERQRREREMGNEQRRQRKKE